MPSLDTKAFVYSLLTGDVGLTAALGAGEIVDAYPDTFEVLPILALSEINNRNVTFSDDSAFADEILVQVDLFASESTTTIFKLVNTIMETALFTRDFASDIPNTDAKIYHKVMRYRRTVTADNLN